MRNSARRALLQCVGQSGQTIRLHHRCCGRHDPGTFDRIFTLNGAITYSAHWSEVITCNLQTQSAPPHGPCWASMEVTNPTRQACYTRASRDPSSPNSSTSEDRQQEGTSSGSSGTTSQKSGITRLAAASQTNLTVQASELLKSRSSTRGRSPGLQELSQAHQRPLGQTTCIDRAEHSSTLPPYHTRHTDLPPDEKHSSRHATSLENEPIAIPKRKNPRPFDLGFRIEA